jgi:hypothetical protein
LYKINIPFCEKKKKGRKGDAERSSKKILLKNDKAKRG